MAEPSTHINYTFEDIQRYLQGKMSAAEMHEIEKAALQDPFLADAIEGYHEVSPTIAQQHLNEINAGLLAEKKESKVVAFNRKTQWLRIAAVVIILAGAGIAGSYIFKSSNKQQQVAQVKREETNKANTAQDTVTIGTPETSSVNKKAVAQNKKPQKSIHPLKKEKTTEPIIEADTQGQEITTARVAASPLQNDETSKSFAPLSNQKINDTVKRNLQDKVSGLNISVNTFSGKVIDENNKPVAGAVIETADKQKAAVTDLNGNFILQKNDSLLNVTAATIGYENKNALLKPNDINLITLKENASALNDVVVTGYGIKKSKAANQTATPIGGWQNFNQYVVTQLNKDSTGKENYISENDVVELEFLIDNSGSPYNIQVTKPLDEVRNLRAINILKSGPKWTTTAKHKKAKVEIAF